MSIQSDNPELTQEMIVGADQFALTADEIPVRVDGHCHIVEPHHHRAPERCHALERELHRVTVPHELQCHVHAATVRDRAHRIGGLRRREARAVHSRGAEAGGQCQLAGVAIGGHHL